MLSSVAASIERTSFEAIARATLLGLQKTTIFLRTKYLYFIAYAFLSVK